MPISGHVTAFLPLASLCVVNTPQACVRLTSGLTFSFQRCSRGSRHTNTSWTPNRLHRLCLTSQSVSFWSAPQRKRPTSWFAEGPTETSGQTARSLDYSRDGTAHLSRRMKARDIGIIMLLYLFSTSLLFTTTRVAAQREKENLKVYPVLHEWLYFKHGL